MKKNIVIFLFIIITVFVIHCEELSYINYANNYNVSEYDIKNILGTYMEKNRKGFLFWVEAEFSWGPGITDTFRNPIQIDVYDDESLYIQEAYYEYKVPEIIKVSDDRYKLNTRYMGELADNATVDACFEFEFSDIETVELSYNESVAQWFGTLPLHMIKLSGPLIKHKPLAGNYVVAVTPYAKDGRVYDSFEALNKGEKEYVRKKIKQKKSNKQ